MANDILETFFSISLPFGNYWKICTQQSIAHICSHFDVELELSFEMILFIAYLCFHWISLISSKDFSQELSRDIHHEHITAHSILQLDFTGLVWERIKNAPSYGIEVSAQCVEDVKTIFNRTDQLFCEHLSALLY